MSAPKDRKLTPIGERIRAALDETGWKQTNAELAMIERGILKHRGSLSSLMTGRRGTKAVNLETLGGIADFFRVDFEWLALGRGDMHRSGKLTTFEAAARYARKNFGAREDAIEAAWEKHKGRAAEMSETEWLYAFDQEAKALGSKPRPEEITAEKLSIRRVGKKKRKQGEDPHDETTAPVPVRPHRRASGV